MLAQSQGSPPLHARDSLQPAGAGLGVTSLQNGQVTPTTASGHLCFFAFLQPTTVASLIAAQAHVPYPAQWHLSIPLLWLQAGMPKSRARLPALPQGVSHHVHPQPSPFLPTSSLQSRSSQSSAFVQPNRLLFCKPSPPSQHWIYTFPYAFGLQVPVDGS